VTGLWFKEELFTGVFLRWWNLALVYKIGGENEEYGNVSLTDGSTGTLIRLEFLTRC